MVGVPLDQGGHVAESPQCHAIQVPHRIAHRRAVRVDEQFLPVEFDGSMARQMNFRDGTRIHGVQIALRLESKIARGDINVVQIQQDPAARFRGDSARRTPTPASANNRIASSSTRSRSRSACPGNPAPARYASSRAARPLRCRAEAADRSQSGRRRNSMTNARTRAPARSGVPRAARAPDAHRRADRSTQWTGRRRAATADNSRESASRPPHAHHRPRSSSRCAPRTRPPPGTRTALADGALPEARCRLSPALSCKPRCA